METIICPECKHRLLVVPDVKEMAKLINEHVSFHTEEMQKKDYSQTQIKLAKEKIEKNLLGKIFEVAGKTDLSRPNESPSVAADFIRKQ